MRFLITGGTGFIGSHLTRRLLEAGHSLNLVVHHRRPDFPEGKSVKFHEADLQDPTLFRNAGFKCEAAINLAGQLRRPGIADETYWKVHYESTKHMLEECAKFKIRHFMLVSTTGVYGATGRAARPETGPFGPGDIYEKTKLEAERYAREQCREDRVGLTIVRPALVYGPGDLHLLALFRAVRGGWFRLIGDGSNLVHPIYIDDLIDGMMKMLPGEPGAGQPGGEPAIFNLAGARAVSFREFCDAAARAVGRARVPGPSIPVGMARLAGGFFEAAHKVTRITPPLTRETVKFMTSDRNYDITRARQALPWDPSMDLDEGMRRAAAWYREKGLLS